jgi:hypothetical protein
VARKIPPRFDAEIVQNWLRECQKYHGTCHKHGESRHIDKLIDCSNRQIVLVRTLDTVPEYVALSYVWGDHNTTPKESKEQPNAIPQVVEDAFTVTQSLGFRYIWVDKYCVDQDDGLKKHEQIMNMDSVYENASQIIIASAGVDKTRGLPGVSSDRRKKVIPFQHANLSLSWIPPAPHKEILESRWATRGWTYQEASLSRRRLVFTDFQVYLECRSCSSFESLHMPLRAYSQSAKLAIFDRPRLFSLPDLVTTPLALSPSQATDSNTKRLPLSREWKTMSFNAYVQCAERYSQRILTFDSDSLNAFGGMIKRFESFKVGILRHLWGIPFFDPHDDHSPGDIVDYAGFLLAGLCWKHDMKVKSPRRRKGFPSWSWTGWEGSITYPRVTTTFDIRTPELYSLASIQLSFEDGSSRSIPDIRENRPSGNRLDQYPKALLQTSAVSRHALPRMLTGQVTSYNWHPSKAGVDAASMIRQIHNGDLKALSLGAIGEMGFLLVVKKKRAAFYRVGLLEVGSELVIKGAPDKEMRTFKLK